MHPVLESRLRLGIYMLAWMAPAGMLVYLLRTAAQMSWSESLAISVPMNVVYAFVSLSPWYHCRRLPLSLERLPFIVAQHALAAAIAALFWIVLAAACAWLLERWFPGVTSRLGRVLGALFGVGILLYSLFVALHYVLISAADSEESERREMEAVMLARDAELKALRAQLNPHFLFNSLNSISALTVANPARAREMCIRLSDFFRSTLRQGEREFIPWREELALALAYLEIEQVRFGARLKVEVSNSSVCEDCLVPPLLIQPLVENAVKHGIAGVVEGGAIKLGARCEGGALMIDIDNPVDADAAPARKTGMGLENVRRRLRTRYGTQARIDTQAGGGRFRVELLLPCHRERRES